MSFSLNPHYAIELRDEA